MKTAVCIANGSSLTKEDVEYCKGKADVYAIKEARHLAPWANYLYAADHDWWDLYNGCPDFEGQRWTLNQDTAKKYGINYIPYDGQLVWGKNGIIATGGNSGFQAVNLAEHHGYERVILLGYDMGFTHNKHWWTGQYKRDTRPSNYKNWIERFEKAKPFMKIEVINCTRQTALDCFEKADLRDVL